MPYPSYSLGIDLGTTYSAAAVLRTGESRPETVPLGDHATAAATMVFLAADGSLLCGAAAHRRAVTDPRRVVREFKRRIGDSIPLVVGGVPVAPEAVAARYVGWVLQRVAEREGGPAGHVALTHPAEWGPHKRAALTGALAEHGITGVTLLTEPEAAAIGYASTERVPVGGTVAVYDLGGGTFDAAVVRKLPDGGFAVAGRPVGIERLGGVDFDEAVFEHVREAIGEAWEQLDPQDPAVHSAVAGLRRECTAAKEALSSDTEVMIPVMLPGRHTQVRLGRAEFEEQIRPAVADTVEALRRALDAAAVTPEQLSAVLMVGGSSRIPLITQLVSAELGRPVAVDADPKSVIALGAAIAADADPAADATTAALAVSAEPVTTALATTALPTSALATSPLAGPAAGRAAGSGAVPPRAPASTVSPPRTRRPDRGLAGLGRPGPKRRQAITVGAAVVGAGLAASVAGWFGLQAFDATGTPPPVANVAEAGPRPGAAPGQGVAEGTLPGIDGWTGEAATDNTVAGPKRPVVLAAASRPGNRTVGGGAAVPTTTVAPPTTTVDDETTTTAPTTTKRTSTTTTTTSVTPTDPDDGGDGDGDDGGDGTTTTDTPPTSSTTTSTDPSSPPPPSE